MQTKEKEIIISIVIPYYCTPKDLYSKCMESILSAPSDRIEVLVIDDGSPQEFYPVLNQYTNDSRVKLIHTPNAGVSSARNRGIKEATGYWVMFVDSDDFVATDALNSIIRYAENNHGDVILFNGGTYSNGKIKNNTSFLKEGINYAANAENQLSVMSSALSVGLLPQGYVQYFSLGAPVCKLIRTDFLKENDICFDTSATFAEDTLFSLQVYNTANDIRYKDYYLYYYVRNSSSITHRYRPGLSEEMDVFFNKVMAFLKANKLESELEYAYYVRVQFEIGRVFTREFFHSENHDKNRRKKYFAFLHSEPYLHTLEKNYVTRKGFEMKVKYYLIMHGHGKLYDQLYTARRKRLLRKA